MNPLFLLLMPLCFLYVVLREADKLRQSGWGERFLAGSILGIAGLLYLFAVFDFEPWMPSDMYEKLAMWFHYRFIQK